MYTSPFMSYKLYGSPGSGSAVIEASLAWIGAQVDVIDVELLENAQQETSYISVNPHGKLPTLVIEEEVITESLAIVLTLAERFPRAGLLPPAGSRERARALRWMSFVVTELYPLIEIIDYPERLAPSPETAGPIKERALDHWKQRWKLLDAHLDGSPFALGCGFSALDLYCTVCSRWDLSETFRQAELPRVHAATQATQSLPQLAEVWAKNIR